MTKKQRLVEEEIARFDALPVKTEAALWEHCARINEICADGLGDPPDLFYRGSLRPPGNPGFGLCCDLDAARRRGAISKDMEDRAMTRMRHWLTPEEVPGTAPGGWWWGHPIRDRGSNKTRVIAAQLLAELAAADPDGLEITM